MSIWGVLEGPKVDPVFFWEFMACCFFLLSAAALIFAIVRGGKAQKREVTIPDGYVTKELCSNNHRDVIKDILQLEKRFDGFTAQRQREVAELHEKVNGVAREVSGLNSALLLNSQRMVQVDAKLDRLIERKEQD